MSVTTILPQTNRPVLSCNTCRHAIAAPLNGHNAVFCSIQCLNAYERLAEIRAADREIWSRGLSRAA